MKELIKEPSIFLLLSAVLCSSLLLAAEKKVRVTAERALIYAEAYKDSYRIDIVTKGTILTVFNSGEPMVSWYYVSFHSKRWNSQVTGFIQAKMVEEVGDKPKEKLPEVKIETPKISVEEVHVPSYLAAYRTFDSLPTLAEEKKPRVLTIVLQREQWEEGIQPRPEKSTVAPTKVKPKVEQITVTESVSVSSVLASVSYDLPASRWEEMPRVFFVIEKQAEELKERLPPEVIPIKPKIEKKKKEPIKEDKTTESEPKETQVGPPIRLEKSSLITLGVGYGPSEGSGVGGFVQWNTKKGFAIHAGIGLYPTTYFYSEHDWVENRVLYSVGVKYYVPFKNNRIKPYLNLQYGGLSVEAVRLITGIWYYQYTYDNFQKTLIGLSLLGGIELRLGKIGLNGAIGLSYNTTAWDYWERDYFLTADVGLLIYLF